MSESTFFISKSATRTLKQCAQQHIGDVSSSHLSESIAASLGFKTHAALRSALEGRATAEAQKPSNSILMQRLHQLGIRRYLMTFGYCRSLNTPIPLLDTSL